MNTLTKSAVRKAMQQYDRGERPFRFTEPRSWYVQGGQERLYPLKYIYALATDQPPSSFNTSEPIRDLELLGFTLVRQPKDEEAEFSSRVKAALGDPKGRAARLKKATPKPSVRLVRTVAYERNPDVVAEVLYRANGICELCEKEAPFVRRSDGSPYLEVHHKKPLAEGGDDTVANAVATCPNCHRKAHLG